MTVDSALQSYRVSRHVKGAIIPLAELLPLPTPLSLLVDPSNICNFRCIFCPTGDPELLRKVGRPKGLMSFDLFQKVIDDLSHFSQPIRVLHLYKDGEPLLNPALARMVALAKESGRVERVETTTNGSLLDPDRARELVEAGIDGVRVSVYALDDAGYRARTRTSTGYATIHDNVESLYRIKSALRPQLHLHCKIIDVGLSEDEKTRFVGAFRGISDSIHVDSIMGWSSTTSRDMTLGSAPQTGICGGPLSANRQTCSEPFMKLCVNFDGGVSVCCVDWAHGTIVGDVRNQRLVDIWTGQRLRKLRLKHLAGRRSEIKACHDCHYIQGLPAYSDLDAEAQRLLPLYQ